MYNHCNLLLQKISVLLFVTTRQAIESIRYAKASLQSVNIQFSAATHHTGKFENLIVSTHTDLIVWYLFAAQFKAYRGGHWHQKIF